jgi:hypothetical protein
VILENLQRWPGIRAVLEHRAAILGLFEKERSAPMAYSAACAAPETSIKITASERKQDFMSVPKCVAHGALDKSFTHACRVHDVE